MKVFINLNKYHLIIILVLIISGCSTENEFEADCSLCDSLNWNNIRTKIEQLNRNNIKSEKISESAELQLNETKEILNHGFKLNLCGCRNGAVFYQIYSATDQSYELKVIPLSNRNYLIKELKPATFSHP